MSELDSHSQSSDQYNDSFSFKENKSYLKISGLPSLERTAAKYLSEGDQFGELLIPLSSFNPFLFPVYINWINIIEVHNFYI